MKVRTTKEAQEQIRKARRWWKKNREKNPGLFQQELEAARKLLSQQPEAGKLYFEVDGRRVQRLLMKKTLRFLQYEIDEDAQIVRITGIRGAKQKDLLAVDAEDEPEPED